jgi:HK97 gp10 family phage protein
MGDFNMNMEIKVQLDPRWRELEGKYTKAVEIAARHVEARAKQICVEKDIIDTGATMNSINAKESGEMVWRIGPTTEYAPFLEFGTIHMIARAFMIPALESETPKFTEAIRQINNELAGLNPGAVRLA